MIPGILVSVKRLTKHVSGASLAPIAEFGLRFARTVALSRLLLPIDLGACVALAAILSSYKLATDVGLEKYVLMFGHETAVPSVAAARQISIGRGCLVGLVLVIFAPTIAHLFGDSVRADTVRWLAAAPMIDGLRNWRVIQLQLDYRFGPQAISVALAQAGALAAALLASVWLRDERVMLISLIVEAAIYTAASHCVASRERLPSVDPKMRRLALSYGLPLMINGVALWALTQFDRIVVVNIFGAATLALYSLAAGLAMLPISVLSLVASNLAFPYLERSRPGQGTADGDAPFNVMFAHFAAAAAYSLAMAIILGSAIPTLYGAQYEISPLFAILLSACTFARIARNGVNLVLLANNGTVKLTIGNLMGGTGPLLGLGAAMIWPKIESVTVGLIVGEAISLTALLLLAHRELPRRSIFTLTALFTVPAMAGLVGLGTTSGGSGLQPVVHSFVFAAGAIGILTSSAVVYRWRPIRL